MKRFIVLVLLVAGAVASPAHAGRPDSREAARPASVALPSEVMSALDGAAAAVAARSAGGDRLVIDAQLAEAVEALARSVEAIPADDVTSFVAFVQAQSLILGRELAGRVRDGSLPGEGALAGAFRALEDAKAGWLRRYPNTGSDGPTNNCFSQLSACYVYCSNLPTWWQRFMCGLDCELDFSACMARAGMSLPIVIRVPGVSSPLLP